MSKEEVSPLRERITDEEIASGLINPITGTYRMIVDDMLPYINPETGRHKYGIQKCSMCSEFKDKSKYSREEEIKPAARRACGSGERQKNA